LDGGKGVWHCEGNQPSASGVASVAPRSGGRKLVFGLCHAFGEGELEQIQFLWGRFRFKRTEGLKLAWHTADQAVNGWAGIEGES